MSAFVNTFEQYFNITFNNYYKINYQLLSLIKYANRKRARIELSSYNKSILWLLKPWLLASLGQQQQWYWLDYVK